MIVNYTQKDIEQFDALFAERDHLLAENEKLINSLRDPNDAPKDPEISVPWDKMTDEQRKEHNRQVDENFKAWLNAGSEEWRQARYENGRIMSEYADKILALSQQIQLREFSKLGGDREKIIENAREQVDLMLKNRHEDIQRMIDTHKNPDGEEISGFSDRAVRVDGKKFYLDKETNINDARQVLSLHYDALKHDKEAIKALDEIVLAQVTNSPYVSSNKGELGATMKLENELPEISVRTTRPDTMLVPTSKLVNEAFLGDLYPGTGKRVNVQKKKLQKKSPVMTLISINLDEMKDQGVSIQGRRELRSYDQEIHDAITSQYVEGANEYITDSMIFDTISGKEGATLNPRQREAISNAITKLMFSHVKIDASQEAEKFGIDKFVYDGSLLPAERVTVSINGTVTECIHLFRTPPLYEYAEKRNQIARMDIKLLNSPVNKNEETIALQGYLYRRILSMKGSSKLPPTIKYETIYKQLEITAASEGALRKKKLTIRKTVKKILDYWKEQGFIRGYVENARKSAKGKIESITIRY